ncbi:MAG: hypothetical protein WKG07_16280 [Hymenobacter sp.]
MDFFQILTDIAKVDADVYARFDTYAAGCSSHMGGLGKKVNGRHPAGPAQHRVTPRRMAKPLAT